MRKLALLAALLASPALAADLPLAGPWSVLLDRTNTGEQNHWQSPDHWATQDAPTVHLPGSLQSQNIGDLPALDSPWTANIGKNKLQDPKYAPYQKPADFKTPFWLTPNRVYVGPAWFKKDITLPANWQNQRILLTLERPHWETTLFLDGTKVGTQNSLAAPHIYDLTQTLHGKMGPHTLILRVDNSLKIPVGPDASSVTDQTQTNWNGVVGNIALSTTSKTFLDDLQLYPNFATKNLHVKVTIRTLTNQPGKGTLILSATGHGLQHREEGAPDLSLPVSWPAEGATLECDYPVPFAKPWDEFAPNLYDLKATLKLDTGEPDARTATFGFRDLATHGTQFTLNNRPIFLRGTLDCAIFPLTGYPPTGQDGEAYWRKIFSTLHAYGLNHLRFHSWTPPEIAFQVADEMGIYLQVEAGVWAAFGSSGKSPTEPQAPDAGGHGGAALDTWIVHETDAIFRGVGNHPSFLLFSNANEPASRNNKPNADFLNALLPTLRAKDPRHLYTAGSNWPNVPNAQFQVMSRPRLNAANVLTRPPQTTFDYANIVSQWPVPLISHETGQWCAYPNFDEIPKFTGTLKPGNLEIFQDFLAKAGMADQAHDFLMASGKFQTLLYKEEIEALLRTPNLGGFQLLGLQDFPGQGTAPVGVVDAFWDPKPYCSSAEFKRFCDSTVPLLRLSKRTFTSDETLTAQIDIAHFGPAPLAAPALSASIHFGNATRVLPISAGPPSIPTGAVTRVATLTLPLNQLPAPTKVTLEVALASNGQTFTNDWDLWVYPQAVALDRAQGLRIFRSWNQDAIAQLESGGNALLILTPEQIAGATRGSFSPIFWNRITFPNPNKEHTLSILCNPAHPALALFPTDFHTNWQWSDLLQPKNAKPMNLHDFPLNLKPLIQVIDDWDTARRLAYAFEARVGHGRLLVCSLNLPLTPLEINTSNTSPAPSLTSQPAAEGLAARQLLASLLHYMASPDFQPTSTLNQLQIKNLLKTP